MLAQEFKILFINVMKYLDLSRLTKISHHIYGIPLYPMKLQTLFLNVIKKNLKNFKEQFYSTV